VSRYGTANRSFYETFKVPPKDTEDKFIYDLGNGQWDLPELRTLLKEVLSNDHPIEEKGEEVVIRVKDSGVGIAPDLLPQIFDLFTQAQRTLDRSQGGLGIGLTVVRKVIEMHGGTTEAHSSGLGRGSEFIVRLPAERSPAQVKIPGAKRAQPGQTWRVLIVDDNADSADSIAAILETSGHEVEVAYSAQKALEMAVEHQPDIVLLDIGLPDMDGYEVAKHLRQTPELKEMRLIAITGYGQESDRQRSREAGFDEHLVKPVEWQKLEELLASLMKRPRSSE